MANQSRKSFLAAAGLGTVALAAASFSFPAGRKGKVIHQVFFWLKNPSSEQDRANLIKGLQTLKKIPVIKELFIGVPAATEQRSVVDSSYHVSELMFFADLASQKAYQEHPVHIKFVEDYSHLWERVVVYDSLRVDKIP